MKIAKRAIDDTMSYKIMAHVGNYVPAVTYSTAQNILTSRNREIAQQYDKVNISMRFYAPTCNWICITDDVTVPQDVLFLVGFNNYA